MTTTAPGWSAPRPTVVCGTTRPTRRFKKRAGRGEAHLLDRPQGDRPAVSVPGPGLPGRRGLHGDADPLAARATGAAGADRGAPAVLERGRRDLARGVHVAVHDARHDHDLLRGHA